MKWFIGILGLIAAFAGYLSYPSMRYQLTGLSPKAPAKPAVVKAPDAAPATAAQPAVTPPAVTPPPVAPPVIDLAKLTPAQLPAQVTLKVTTEVGDASGLKMKIDPGNRLTLVRLEGDQVVVSPGSGPFEGRVPVSGTDLMEQLQANPPVIAPEPTPTPTPDPAVPTPAAEATTPAVTPAATPSGDSQVPVTSPPATEPSTPVTPAATSGSGASTDPVEVMKANLRSGAIKEFTFEQVLEWKAAGDEVVNGETFQTGTVQYKGDTIFGVKTFDAKALMQNGKVVRWVWTKSNIEIK